MNQFIITGDTYGSGSHVTGNIYTVSMGHIKLHFSYKTLIGVHVFGGPGDLPEASYRQKNAWGPTTGKHMKMCGLDRAAIRTEDELYEIVRGALFVDVVHAPLNQGEAA